MGLKLLRTGIVSTKIYVQVGQSLFQTGPNISKCGVTLLHVISTSNILMW